MTPTMFRFAVDSAQFATFAHRTPYGIDRLNGFKMYINSAKLMCVDVKSVDHLQMDSTDCDSYEKYSK